MDDGIPCLWMRGGTSKGATPVLLDPAPDGAVCGARMPRTAGKLFDGPVLPGGGALTGAASARRRTALARPIRRAERLRPRQ